MNSTSPQQKTGGQLFTGKVVKKSGKQTVSVEVARVLQHPLYRKSMKRTKRYLAHDPQEKCQVGDTVTIRASRPISRHKHFMVVYPK